MIVRSQTIAAVVMGLWMAHPLLAQEPPRLEGSAKGPTSTPQLTANQRLANVIANQLRQSGQLQHYAINVAFQDGTAELTGSVADQLQREEALRIIQGVPGVERVRDRLTMIPSSSIKQAQAAAPAPLEPPAHKDPQIAELNNGGTTEPMPIFQAPNPAAYDLNPPKMPPCAWPTYAPYNNYSRVAYPTQYPYQSWPFIGPVYPFPQVPLGWRKVKLEWEDGYWWYSRHSNSNDWWRLRYW